MSDSINIGRLSPAQIVGLLTGELEHESRNLVLLRAITTREASARWGDFSSLAHNWQMLDQPGIMAEEQSEPDSFDVVWVPIIADVDDDFVVTANQVLPIIGVFTLVLSSVRRAWLVHDFTEHSRRPRPEDVPRD